MNSNAEFDSIFAVSENKIIDWYEYFSVKYNNKLTANTVFPLLLYPAINIEESYFILRSSTFKTLLSKRLLYVSMIYF